MKMESQELATKEARGGTLAEERPSYASQLGTSSQELPSSPIQQEIKQEQDEQCWEVQWKKYLKTLQDPDLGRRNLKFPWFPLEEDSNKFQVSSRGEVAEIHPLPLKESVMRTWLGLSGEGQESSPDPSVKVKEETVEEEDSLESRRQDFRCFPYQEAKPPGEICRQLLGLCCQWLKPDRHSVDQILDLLVLEQFLAILPEKMQRWIRAGGAESCAQAVLLAEYFLWCLPNMENTEVQVFEPFEEVIVSSPKIEQEESEAEEYQLSLEAEPVDEGEGGLLQAMEGSRQRRKSNGEPQRPEQDAVSNVSPERDRGSVFQTPEVEERLENDQQTKKQCGNHPGKKLRKDFICQEGRHLNESSSQERTSTAKPQKSRKGLNPTSYQKKSQKGPYACSYCGKKWPCPSQLLRHESIHMGEKLHKCIKCGKSFNRRSNLTTHERTHTGEKPHQCSQCGKSFIRRTHLMKHKRSHVKENPCNCLGCSRRNSSLSLISHVNIDPRHHGLAHGHSFPHGKTPKSEVALTEGKPYQCCDCRKSFSCHSHFLRHEKSHAKERPHKCTDCGKSFCTRSNLSQHWRTHTGERPYSCKHCGKSYRRKSSLVQHQQETCQKGNCLNGLPVGFVVLGNCALLCMKQPAQVGATGPVDPKVEMISRHLNF